MDWRLRRWRLRFLALSNAPQNFQPQKNQMIGTLTSQAFSIFFLNYLFHNRAKRINNFSLFSVGRIATKTRRRRESPGGRGGTKKEGGRRRKGKEREGGGRAPQNRGRTDYFPHAVRISAFLGNVLQTHIVFQRTSSGFYP